MAGELGKLGQLGHMLARDLSNSEILEQLYLVENAHTSFLTLLWKVNLVFGMGCNEGLQLRESLIQARDDRELRHVHIEPQGFEYLGRRTDPRNYNKNPHLRNKAAVSHAEAVPNTARPRAGG